MQNARAKIDEVFMTLQASMECPCEVIAKINGVNENRKSSRLRRLVRNSRKCLGVPTEAIIALSVGLLFGGASGRLCFRQCGGYASQGQAHCIHSNKLWQRNILQSPSLAELCDLAVKRLHCAWQVSPC